MRKYYSLFFCALGSTGLVNLAVAQQDGELVGLEIRAGVDVRSVDNADLQPSGEDNIRETQTVTSLSANGQLVGAWSEFNTNYRLEDRRHSKLSEEDERQILGDSSLIFGPQHRRYYLQLSHSSREVSIDPLAVDLQSNRDNREIFSGSLHGSVTPGRGNTLSLWAGATDIQFDVSRENEAKRYSAGLAFDHAVSPVSYAGLTATGYELKYRNIEDSDVRYSRVAAVWRTELRRVAYGVEIGGNHVEGETDSTTSPSVAADLTYRSGAQSLIVSYNQYLSDTSQGGQETTEFDPSVEVDGRLDGVIDQFRLQQFSLTWSHTQVCSGCSVQLDFNIDRETYVSFAELDSREIRTGARFDYRASPSVTLSLRGEYGDFEEVNEEPPTGYNQTLVDFSVKFPRIIRDGQLDLFVGKVKRDFKSANDYTYNYVGAEFTYLLYDY